MVFFLAPRARAQDLRIIQSQHYRIHTDLDEEIVSDLSHRMDAMYDEYARRLADFPRPDDSVPLEAYLVRTKEKYLHLVGLTMAGTGGAFNANRHLLAAFLDGQGADALRRTLQHEAFHQFAFDAIGRNIPIWLNEGLAQVFEEGIWTGSGFLLGQVPPRRLRQLHADIEGGSLIQFPDLLAMDAPGWAKGWRDPARSATQYNQSWAMAHFLVYATDEQGRLKYRSRLIEMLKLLRSGTNGQDAFRAAFSANIDGFRDRFSEYADDLAATPQATLIEHQGVLADILIAMSQHGRTFSDFEEFKRLCIAEDWRIHYTLGGLQWSSANDPSIYFCSPGNGADGPDVQHFELAANRPLPDLVCECAGLRLRTRFSQGASKMEHETIVAGL
ncbi:MAG: DUF1570 domain-containing protein [Tepidisphaeraceae bacterium]